MTDTPEVQPLVASTPTWALEYPNDYNQPADSPNAFKNLAEDVDAALSALRSQSEGAYVKGPMATQTADWNTAENTGFYKSWPGAANAPMMSLGDVPWLGMVIRFDGNWIIQQAWPYAPYPRLTIMTRVCLNAGTWSEWRRDANYSYSWGTLDGLHFLKHGPNEVSRFAHGFAKDPANGNPTALDEYRVQCYDTAGNFTWSAIKIPESGIVSFPRGHATALQRIADGEPIDSDQAVTVGMLIELLRRAGVEISWE